jgi:predicted nucleic acid-binding protein
MERFALKYLIDSVIVIDHLNGIESATAFLREHGTAAALSVVTRAEVLAGSSDDHADAVLALLNSFPALPITVDIADLAATLRRTQRWKLPDALQAAVAIRHDRVLVTRNTRDFQAGGTDPVVLVPYRL